MFSLHAVSAPDILTLLHCTHGVEIKQLCKNLNRQPLEPSGETNRGLSLLASSEWLLHQDLTYWTNLGKLASLILLPVPLSTQPAGSTIKNRTWKAHTWHKNVQYHINKVDLHILQVAKELHVPRPSALQEGIATPECDDGVNEIW